MDVLGYSIMGMTLNKINSQSLNHIVTTRSKASYHQLENCTQLRPMSLVHPARLVQTLAVKFHDCPIGWTEGLICEYPRSFECA